MTAEKVVGLDRVTRLFDVANDGTDKDSWAEKFKDYTSKTIAQHRQGMPEAELLDLKSDLLRIVEERLEARCSKLDVNLENAMKEFHAERLRLFKEALQLAGYSPAPESNQVEPNQVEIILGPPSTNSDAKDSTAKYVADTAVRRKAPEDLHKVFDSMQVSSWSSGRFKLIRKLCEATRNYGVVQLMQDMEDDRLLAVKQMPNSWICKHHEDFIRQHPSETEDPWQDLGCTSFLNSVDYQYGCKLHGVYRDGQHTYVASSFATEGDLFTCAQAGDPPGPEREKQFAPLVVQLLTGVRQLHDMQIVHRDISLENVLLTQLEGLSGCFDKEIRIIDYGMASTGRTFKDCVRGKASYQAPEMHGSQDYDAFLSDSFSVGVILYAMMLKDYPWLSTRPGSCKCFEYVQKHGFRSYCAKRKVRGLNMRVSDCISEDLTRFFEGMLALDPEKRLTLGESQWPADRRSVWDEPWVQMCLTNARQASNGSVD